MGAAHGRGGGNGGVAPSNEGPGLRDASPLPAPAPGNVVMRIHRIRGEVVVAACDSELVETELRVGRTQVKISSYFYGRMAVSEEEFVAHVRRGTIVNLLGERTVRWAVKAGLLAAEGAGSLGGVPHAEIVDLPS